MSCDPRNPINEKEVIRLCQLARLSIPPAERLSLRRDLSRLLEFVAVLDQSVAGVSIPSNRRRGLHLNWRGDDSLESPTPGEALRNAPATKGDYFSVPPVIDPFSDTERNSREETI